MKAALITPLVILLIPSFALTPRADLIITGVVTDSDSGAPLPGAQISVVGAQVGTLSAANGRYRLVIPTALRGPELRLGASLIGYTRLVRSVQVQGDSVTVNFSLAQSALGLNELVVGGQGGRGGRGYSFRTDAAAAVAVVPAPPMPAAAPRGGFNTESYDLIEENPFVAVSAAPLSTFSVDVDRASYSNIRRFLREGKLPPKDAVRIEEMINYFKYDYAAPAAQQPFSITTETAPAPWQPRHRLLRVALQTAQVNLAELPPNNLVFLIDVSGSMTPANKLPLLKQALRLLVSELRPVDRVAMVVYAGRAGLVLPTTNGDQKDKILDALNALEAGGSTAGGAGLRLAYDVARENHLVGGNNRVILATDGDFNVGVSSDAEMVRLIEERRQQGTFLTVLGFGMGNLKDSKLEKLADHGNGNYAYIDDLLEARKVLVTEAGGTLVTVAKDVKLQLEFNPSKVRAYRLIGYENRLLRAEDFANDQKDAGEIGAGHSVTALYEIMPVGVEGTVELAAPSQLRYQEPTTQRAAAATDELLLVKVRYKAPDSNTSSLIEHVVRDRVTNASADLRFAASVAGFGMLLRTSKYGGQTTIDLVLDLARKSLGTDAGGYRGEFIRMVETARGLGMPAAVSAAKQ